MTETRKLAAILVSDVVGYSRLAGADEDDVLARLRTLRAGAAAPQFASECPPRRFDCPKPSVRCRPSSATGDQPANVSDGSMAPVRPAPAERRSWGL